MSIANNLNIAKVCVSLTIKAIEQGLEQDLNYPRKLYIAYQAINDINTDNSSDSTLTATNDFLFALCGGYAFQAQDILNLGGGGVVPTQPSSGGLSPYPIGVTVSVGQSGVSTLQSSDWVGLVDINLTAVINNGVFTYGSDYTFNTLTGTFSFALCGYVFQTGDKFSTYAFKPTS
jgi:hypothetical protein